MQHMPTNYFLIFLVIGKAHDKRYITLCLEEASTTVIIQIQDEKTQTTIIISQAIKKTVHQHAQCSLAD